MFISVVFLTIQFLNIVFCALPLSCSSPIYCHGRLLHTVQMAGIFNDSKTFVDMQMRRSENEILDKFDQLMETTENKPTREQLLTFIEENFSRNDELQAVRPCDWTSEPSILKKIADPSLRGWARELNKLWLILARQVREEVLQNPERYSLEPIPNLFIIPGGRFKEPYYWDSYWIISGLLLTDMHDTAKSMIDNFLWFVNKYGYIPNGGRIYYSQRSQPPLLSAMVTRYIETTKDLIWLKSILPLVDEELEWWLNERTVKVQNYTLAHYFAPSEGPRPESYKEDFITAQNQQEIFTELKSGAESGWDFSYRWVVDKNGTNNGNLSHLKTSHVVPVDLNSFLCGAFDNVANLHLLLGNSVKAKKWRQKANEWKMAIEQLMWNEEYGTWFDVLVATGKQRNNFYPSNIFPLWTRCIPNKRELEQKGDRVAHYLETSGALSYLGGVPTSLQLTGEQWDLPNAWPPLQGVMSQALMRSGSDKAISIAKKITERWVRANLIGFRSSGEMYEKYDAEVPGQFGGGGEYLVQAGFGWTNGVILEMLHESGSWLTEK